MPSVPSLKLHCAFTEVFKSFDTILYILCLTSTLILLPNYLLIHPFSLLYFLVLVSNYAVIYWLPNSWRNTSTSQMLCNMFITNLACSNLMFSVCSHSYSAFTFYFFNVFVVGIVSITFRLTVVLYLSSVMCTENTLKITPLFWNVNNHVSKDRSKFK